MAVLELPVVLLESAAEPVAVLLIPLVLLPSASTPVPVLPVPVVVLHSAPIPTAVLVSPKAFGASESAKHASASQMTGKPCFKGERLVDVLIGIVVIFFDFIFLLSWRFD